PPPKPPCADVLMRGITGRSATVACGPTAPSPLAACPIARDTRSTPLMLPFSRSRASAGLFPCCSIARSSPIASPSDIRQDQLASSARYVGRLLPKQEQQDTGLLAPQPITTRGRQRRSVSPSRR